MKNALEFAGDTQQKPEDSPEGLGDYLHDPEVETRSISELNTQWSRMRKADLLLELGRQHRANCILQQRQNMLQNMVHDYAEKATRMRKQLLDLGTLLEEIREAFMKAQSANRLKYMSMVRMITGLWVLVGLLLAALAYAGVFG